MIIVKYKFSTDVDTLPVFNDGFEYTHSDEVNDDSTTTRTIESSDYPTSISFQASTGLKEILYLDLSNVENVEDIFKDCNALNKIISSPEQISILVNELPQKTLFNPGYIDVPEAASIDDIQCNRELNSRHWYISGKDYLDLFVMMGQSNMEGQSETYKEFNVPDYQSCTQSYLTGDIIQVKHPFGENINTLGDASELGYYQMEGAVGCETGLPYGSLSPHFAAKYYEMTGVPTLITPCCCGASTISQWLPGHAQGRYELTVDKVNKSVQAVNDTLNRPIRNKYLVWLQGESDGIYRTGTAKYKERFLKLWNKLKEDCGLEKCFIIRVAKFRPDKYNDKPIIEAQEQLALENPDIEMVTRITGYLEHPAENPENPTIQDGVTPGYPYVDHYTWAGYKLVGETAGERIGTYINTGEMPILEEEPYVNEITSSSEKIVAEYKFNNTVTADLLPTFYDGYKISRVVDTVADTITTRKVIATESPSEMYFTGSTALLEVLDVDISNIIEAKQMFESCSNLTHVKLGDEPTPKLISLERMFNLCKKLVSIDFGGLTTDNLEFLSATFSDCASMTTIPVSNWNVKKVTSLAATFRRCTKLVDLDLSNWEIDGLIYASGTFTNDYALKSINLSKVNVEPLENAQQMFYGCRALTELDLSTWKTRPDIQLTFFVGDCQKLETLDISNFNIAANNSYMTKFIYGSPKLEHIGMLYCNEETCNKVISNMQAASGLVRKIYVTDTNSKQYAESNNYKIIDYDYKKETVRLELPKSLGVNDKLYWDNDKQRYCINSNGEITDTDITKRVLLKGYNNIIVQMAENNIVPPAGISLRIPKK